MMEIQNQQYIAQLVVLYIQNRLSDEQVQDLKAWRSESESHEALFQNMLLESYWNERIVRFVKSESESDAEWRKIRRVTLGEPRVMWRKVMRYAAVWLLLLTVAGGVFYFVNRESGRDETTLMAFVPGGRNAVLELPDGTLVDLKSAGERGEVQGTNWSVVRDSLKYQMAKRNEEEVYHTLRVPRGGEYTLVLSDGTKVFLNAESSLRYPVHFCGDFRKVELEGEAFFEVTHNAERPFIVKVGALQVNVLGTCFGVRAYSDETDVRTTLVSGRVNVLVESRVYTVNPSEQAVYDKSSNCVTVEPVNTELFVGWKDGRLVFDNCPLEVILSVLSRWYSFEVFYVGEGVKAVPFSLNVRKYDEITAVLELMQSTGKIRFESKRNTIIVR